MALALSVSNYLTQKLKARSKPSLYLSITGAGIGRNGRKVITEFVKHPKGKKERQKVLLKRARKFLKSELQEGLVPWKRHVATDKWTERTAGDYVWCYVRYLLRHVSREKCLEGTRKKAHCCDQAYQEYQEYLKAKRAFEAVRMWNSRYPHVPEPAQDGAGAEEVESSEEEAAGAEGGSTAVSEGNASGSGTIQEPSLSGAEDSEGEGEADGEVAEVSMSAGEEGEVEPPLSGAEAEADGSEVMQVSEEEPPLGGAEAEADESEVTEVSVEEPPLARAEAEADGSEAVERSEEEPPLTGAEAEADESEVMEGSIFTDDESEVELEEQELPQGAPATLPATEASWPAAAQQRPCEGPCAPVGVRLLVLNEGGSEPLHTFTMAEGDTIDLGRAQDCEIIRISDPTVSRSHAKLRLAGGRLTVEDLGSRNGTGMDVPGQKEPTRLSEETPVPDGAMILIPWETMTRADEARARLRILYGQTSSGTASIVAVLSIPPSQPLRHEEGHISSGAGRTPVEPKEQLAPHVRGAEASKVPGTPWGRVPAPGAAAPGDVEVRSKQFTPTTISPDHCIARAWADGRGDQCKCPAVYGELCATHVKCGTKHGRVDGPIPEPKLQEFERAQKKRAAQPEGGVPVHVPCSECGRKKRRQAGSAPGTPAAPGSLPKAPGTPAAPSAAPSASPPSHISTSEASKPQGSIESPTRPQAAETVLGPPAPVRRHFSRQEVKTRMDSCAACQAFWAGKVHCAKGHTCDLTPEQLLYERDRRTGQASKRKRSQCKTPRAHSQEGTATAGASGTSSSSSAAPSQVHPPGSEFGRSSVALRRPPVMPNVEGAPPPLPLIGASNPGATSLVSSQEPGSRKEPEEQGRGAIPVLASKRPLVGKLKDPRI